MNKLLEIYPKSFNKKSVNSLEILARNEGIDYKNLSYKIVFYDETDVKLPEINFFKEV